MKRAIIKGFDDRARTLCDKDNINDKLSNLEKMLGALMAKFGSTSLRNSTKLLKIENID